MISVFVTVKKLVSLRKRIVLHLILLPLLSTSLVLKTDSKKDTFYQKLKIKFSILYACWCSFGTVFNKVILFILKIIMTAIYKIRHLTRIQKIVQYGCRIEINKFTKKSLGQVFVVEKSYFSQTESSEIYLENRIVYRSSSIWRRT